MLINNNIQAVTGAYNVSTSTSARHTSKTEAAKDADEVQLSTGVQSFSGLLQQLRGTDATRSEKVSALSQQMADGSYSVKAENIASSLLDTRF
ncbi:MAG: flagellar biosynthesis anti-sigma factor FlgM [Selenomonas sp.]|jgi:negative regulator of flagellin synthesis FlgM|nr:flagellar biosynthesis anti-sigma factor FlgM [Selenomonas sp.]